MSIVVVGGNDSMIRRYKDLCKQYKCDAKVFTQMRDGLRGRIGCPDLLVLFTSTTSHKMVQCALSEIKGQDVIIARSHSSSISALRNILEEHVS